MGDCMGTRGTAAGRERASDAAAAVSDVPLPKPGTGRGLYTLRGDGGRSCVSSSTGSAGIAGGTECSQSITACTLSRNLHISGMLASMLVDCTFVRMVLNSVAFSARSVFTTEGCNDEGEDAGPCVDVGVADATATARMCGGRDDK